jgi:hypothetical protein
MAAPDEGAPASHPQLARLHGHPLGTAHGIRRDREQRAGDVEGAVEVDREGPTVETGRVVGRRQSRPVERRALLDVAIGDEIDSVREEEARCSEAVEAKQHVLQAGPAELLDRPAAFAADRGDDPAEGVLCGRGPDRGDVERFVEGERRADVGRQFSGARKQPLPGGIGPDARLRLVVAGALVEAVGMAEEKAREDFVRVLAEPGPRHRPGTTGVPHDRRCPLVVRVPAEAPGRGQQVGLVLGLSPQRDGRRGLPIEGQRELLVQ